MDVTPARRRADRAVLLGLDRGDDRVHRAVAGAGELGHQRALADDRQVGAGLGVEQLVLDADDRGAGAAQHAAAYDVLRVGGRGLVEHRGRGRAPVDQQRVVVVVAQADPADVARVGVELRPQVETPEHQPLVGGVELGDPLGGLEHHRVALDEPALVAQPAAVVTLRGPAAGRPWPTSPAGRTPGRRTPARPRSPAPAALPTNLTPHPMRPPCSRLPAGTRQASPQHYSVEGAGHLFLAVQERRHRRARLVGGEQPGAQRGHLLAVGVDAGDQVAVEDRLRLAQPLRVRRWPAGRTPRPPARRGRSAGTASVTSPYAAASTPLNTSPPRVVRAAARGFIRACTVSEMIAAARPSFTSVSAKVASSSGDHDVGGGHDADAAGADGAVHAGRRPACSSWRSTAGARRSGGRRPPCPRPSPRTGRRPSRTPGRRR